MLNFMFLRSFFLNSIVEFSRIDFKFSQKDEKSGKLCAKIVENVRKIIENLFRKFR